MDPMTTTEEITVIEQFNVTVEHLSRDFEVVHVPTSYRTDFRGETVVARNERLELRLLAPETPRGYLFYGDEWKDVGPKGVKKLRKRAEDGTARAVADDKLYPTLLQLLQETGGIVGCPSTMSETPAKVGDTVVLHSRGKYRPAIVTHVTKTGTVTGAYITQGGLDEAVRYRGPGAEAQITRKAAKLGEYFIWVEA